MQEKSRTKFNIHDVFAIVAAVVATIVFLVYGFIRYPIFESGTTVNVYYQNRLIDTYDLNVDQTLVYCRNEEDGETMGRVCTKSGFSDFQGPVVVLEIKDKKIKIGEETSNKHLCSTQGSIGTGNTPLICLPNSFIAVIVAENKGGFDN